MPQDLEPQEAQQAANSAEEPAQEDPVFLEGAKVYRCACPCEACRWAKDFS